VRTRRCHGLGALSPGAGGGRLDRRRRARAERAGTVRAQDLRTLLRLKNKPLVDGGARRHVREHHAAERAVAPRALRRKVVHSCGEQHGLPGQRDAPAHVREAPLARGGLELQHRRQHRAQCRGVAPRRLRAGRCASDRREVQRRER